MPSKLLNPSQIKSAVRKHSDGEKLIADGEGLFLRLRPGARADWLLIYSVSGKRKKLGLGPLSEINVARAREKAAEAREFIDRGKDPATERRRLHAEQRAADADAAARHTIAKLFEEWYRREMSQTKKAKELRRTFEKDVLPQIGSMYADEVRRRHIMPVLDAVKERGARRATNILLQYLRQMFRYATVREIVDGDPSFGITKASAGGKDAERTRTLSEDEIRTIADQMPAAKFPPRTEIAFWITLSTVARIGEVSRARRSDIDLEARTWTIPAEVAKNGREHLVHLSEFAVDEFKKLIALAPGDWLFPDRTGKTHIYDKALQKQFRDRQACHPGNRKAGARRPEKWAPALRLKGGRWTSHDLRRTGATMMGELGVRSDVIDRCMNHISEDRLKKTYQQQTLMSERRQAFELLGERLALLRYADAGRVVPGRFGRAA
ncbi:MAG: tyrosine-type recombinase/integrase [Sinimarinibacterium flocculans]|uniref:tyrosine-type recombinase/integrase n=1 Tax=Sinimarinibacterium flocculans TaxID=985250 RepID=UPI003C3BE14C